MITASSKTWLIISVKCDYCLIDNKYLIKIIEWSSHTIWYINKITFIEFLTILIGLNTRIKRICFDYLKYNNLTKHSSDSGNIILYISDFKISQD